MFYNEKFLTSFLHEKVIFKFSFLSPDNFTEKLREN